MNHRPATLGEQARVVAALSFLGLTADQVAQDRTAINTAYKRVARTVHPDVCTGPDAARLFALAKDARDLLGQFQFEPVRPPVEVRTRGANAAASPWMSHSN